MCNSIAPEGKMAPVRYNGVLLRTQFTLFDWINKAVRWSRKKSTLRLT